MTASYQVEILDSNGDPAAVLDSTVWAALRYEIVLDDVGLFQMTLPLDDDRNALIHKHTWVQVYRYPTEDDEQDEQTYIICYRKRFIDDDELGWAIYGGFTLEFLLLQRHIDPANDPLVAGGFSTKQTAVDIVMSELAEEQAGSDAVAIQQIPNLTVETPMGAGDIVSVRLQWENLLEELRDLATAHNMDFKLSRTGGTNLLFSAKRIGSDRTKTTNFPLNQPYVLLTPELGRISAPELEEDWRDEKTYVYLLGKGAGENRELYGAMADAEIESPYGFAAIVVDARDSDLIADYVSQAQQVLAKNRAKKTFTFQIHRTEEHYKKLFNLGDWVTIEWLDHSEDMRFVRFNVDLTDEEQITTEVAGQYASE